MGRSAEPVNFWLLQTGEPLPVDGEIRPFRTGMLAHILKDRGHEVHWWASTFDHMKKTQRSQKSALVNIRPGMDLHLIKGPGYKKNISVQRIFHHRAVAREFTSLAERQSKPDLIISAMPTIELSHAAVNFGKRYGIPVILDFRDMWPDIFLEALPESIRFLGRLAILPLLAEFRTTARSAFALYSITPEFLSWARTTAGRPENPCDRYFWHSYRDQDMREDKLSNARNFWKQKGLDAERDFILCHFGVMSKKLDMAPVLAAARDFQDAGLPFKFVICGTGDLLEPYRKQAIDCKNVILPGWVGASEIKTLMNMSIAGLAPYHSRRDFLISVPSKAVEYLAGGLPIVSSLGGSLENLLRQHGCGLTYRNGDSEDLKKNLLDLVRVPGKRDLMASQARKLFETQFCADKVMVGMAESLERAVGHYRQTHLALSGLPSPHLLGLNETLV